jgi:hypothetical protein
MTLWVTMIPWLRRDRGSPAGRVARQREYPLCTLAPLS